MDSVTYQTYLKLPELYINMITSTNGNILRVTGPFCGEFTGHRLSCHYGVDADLL